MKCKICGDIATRSNGKGEVYCDRHYWEYGADGSSVAEQVEARKYDVKGNED